MWNKIKIVAGIGNEQNSEEAYTYLCKSVRARLNVLLLNKQTLMRSLFVVIV